MQRLMIGIIVAGLLAYVVDVYAEEPKQPKEIPPSPELVACQKQVQTLNNVLSGLGQGIQREMEFAALKLQALQGKSEK